MTNFCSKCGNKLSSEANFCNRCGNKIIRDKTDNNYQIINTQNFSDNSQNSNKDKENFAKNLAYKHACKLMCGETNNYKKAIEEFERLNDYKDSKYKLEECKKEIEKKEIETKQEMYNKACAQMKGDRSNVIEAISIFDDIKSFKDVNDKIKECQNIVKKIDDEKKETLYKNACNLMINNFEDFEKKSFTDKLIMTNLVLNNNNEALNAFNSIKNYKDSEEKIKECENVKEKLEAQKKQYDQKIIFVSLVLVLAGLMGYAAAFFIRPIYNRYEFDNIIAKEDYGLIYRLSYNPDFIEYSSDEQCKKVIDYLITNTKKDDLNVKYGIFDNPTFKKINDITLGQNNINSIVNSFRSDNDVENRYRLLDNPNFDKYGNKTIAEEQLRIIAVDLTSDLQNFNDCGCYQSIIDDNLKSASIASKYKFLDKLCFKKYGNESLGKDVTDSIYLIVLGSDIDEKLKLLSNQSTKPYLGEIHRKELIDSLFKILEYLNDSQLDKFLLEVCSKDDLNKIKEIGDKLPNNYCNWLIEKTLAQNKSQNLTILNGFLANNETAKNIIALKVSDLLKSNIYSEYYKPDDIETIVKAFPWAFDNNIKDLLEKWKIGFDGIKEAEKVCSSSGYSTIESLKKEREGYSDFVYLTGNVIRFVNTATFGDGRVGEIYLISSNYESALLYTRYTSFSTTGRFNLYAQEMKDHPNISYFRSEYGISKVYFEVSKYDYERNLKRYQELGSEIYNLEKASKEYEELRDKDNEALKTVKEKLLYSLSFNTLLAKVGIEMIWCPAGIFMIGSQDNELGRGIDEKRYKVKISKSFFIGKYEVTQKQYKKVMDYNPSKNKGDNNPVETVSWNDAKEFCNKLNSVYKDYLPKDYRFDLPTEAQWEYTCRAGTTTALNNSKNITTENGYCPNLDEVAWFDKNSGIQTHPVGQKKPNAWGIYDMHGNVWEWCRDYYGDYSKTSWIDPIGKDVSDLVCRGGSAFYSARYNRSANRESHHSYFSTNELGFRIALVPED